MRAMDVAAFERVHQAFEQFHSFFAPAFGRKQWREHSQHYLQGLLVQCQVRWTPLLGQSRGRIKRKCLRTSRDASVPEWCPGR